MITPNVTAGQTAPPSKHISNDVPRVAADAVKTVAKAAVEKTRQVAAQPPSAEQLKNAVDVINTVMRQSSNSLEFSIDNDTKKPIVKLVDTETGELIRQYPSEEALAISRSIDRFQQGMLLKQQA